MNVVTRTIIFLFMGKTVRNLITGAIKTIAILIVGEATRNLITETIHTMRKVMPVGRMATIFVTKGAALNGKVKIIFVTPVLSGKTVIVLIAIFIKELNVLTLLMLALLFTIYSNAMNFVELLSSTLSKIFFRFLIANVSQSITILRIFIAYVSQRVTGSTENLAYTICIIVGGLSFALHRKSRDLQKRKFGVYIF